MAEQKQEQNPHGTGWIEWFARNHVAANILMLLFLVGGAMSVFQMRTETFPAIDPKMVYVSVSYPGATPYEVADSITSRVEQELVGIEGVKRVTSTAIEGHGSIIVELEDFADGDEVYNDVETQVNAISDFPPEDAERAIVTKLKPTPSVMTLALYGDTSEDALRFWVDTIEDELLLLPDVALTSIRGVKDYQISVEISESTLRHYGLTLAEVSEAVGANSIDTPAGTIESQQGDILLRVQEKRYTGAEFEKIVLRSMPDGSKLTIGDVGQVVDGFDDVNLVSTYNGKNAAYIDITRTETEDTLSVAGSIKDYLKTITLPQGMHIAVLEDETVRLSERISLMLRNAVLGFALVFLILLLFLDLKLAFWTSIAIPVSFLGGLLVVGMLGYSINMISLFALIVVLGIVVDDAIIVGESIFEAQEDAKKNNTGEDKYTVLLKALKSVVGPVTVGVTTTMAAFAPLIFSTGVLGQIIGVIPIVVIPILAISLLEAYFILPSHLSNPTRWNRGILVDIRRKVSAGLHWFVEHIVVRLARFSIRWRYVTCAAFFTFAVFTMTLVSTGAIRFVFMPDIEGDTIKISVALPEGTPFEKTTAVMQRIEDDINTVQKKLEDHAGYNIFKSIAVTIGEQASSSGGPVGGGQSSSGSNLGQTKIHLVSSDERDVAASEIEAMIRARVDTIPGIETLDFQSSLIGDDPDIEIELQHPAEEELNKAAEELKERLADLQGATDVADSFEEGKKEFVFRLNDQGYAVGLTPAMIGQQLRSAFFGYEAQRFQRDGSEVIVYVRYPKHERESINTLYNARIRLSSGEEVPLSSVATIREQQGYSKIETVDGRRIVSVTADVDTAISTPDEVIRVLNSDVLPELKSHYPGLSYSYEGATRDQKEDMVSLFENMKIALLLIFVLLGAQLRSYIQPVIIMMAIPFGVVGAIWGHVLLGYDLTFISMFGIVALAGVVVNDSVVLVDYKNRMIEQGYSVYDAAIMAIRRRFRPILLTTLTTSLGLFPILMETSIQAKFLVPMVISLATGIVFSTTVILILIPCMLVILDDIRHGAQRLLDPLKSNVKMKLGKTLDKNKNA